MRDVIIAIVGVVAGVIAESVAYSFRRKADRMIELGDDEEMSRNGIVLNKAPL